MLDHRQHLPIDSLPLAGGANKCRAVRAAKKSNQGGASRTTAEGGASRRTIAGTEARRRMEEWQRVGGGVGKLSDLRSACEGESEGEGS